MALGSLFLLASLELLALLSGMVLARGLGRRIPIWTSVTALALPVVVLIPWFYGNILFVPTVSLSHLPGATPRSDPFDAALNDTVFKFLPLELEVRHALAEHRLPWWSEVVDGGSNLWANPEAQVLSPFALLARCAWIQHHLLVAYALKVEVALLGFVLLAGALGVRPRARFLGAVAFAIGGAVSGWAVFPLSGVAALGPWLVLGALTLVRRPSRAAMAVTALVLAALIFAGHPESALGVGLLAALAALSLRSRRVGLGRAITALAGAVALGLGLSAVQWLPFLAELGDSARVVELASARAPSPAGHARKLAFWFPDPIRRRYLGGPFHPAPYWGQARGPELDARHHWTYDTTMWSGLAMVVGVALATAGGRRRRLLPCFAAWAFTLLAVAHFRPVMALLAVTPVLRLVESSRLLPAGVLAWSLLGAAGLDGLLRPAGRRVPRGLLAALAALALAATLGSPRTLVLPAILLLVVLGARAAGRPSFGGLAFLLLTSATLVDLVPWARQVAPRGRVSEHYPRSPLLDLLVRETHAPGGPWRFVGHDRMVYPNQLAPYGIADVRPHNPLVPSARLGTLRAAFGFAPTTAEYFGAFRNLDHPFLDFLNVRLVLTHPHLPPLAGMPRLSPEDEWLELRQNPEALPRFFVPASTEVVADRDLAGWIARLRDPRSVALSAPVPPLPPSLARDPRVLLFQPGRIELALAPNTGPLLASSVPDPEGWRVYAHGHRLDTVTVNGAYLGVLLPPETERLELRFVPPGLLPGAVLSALSLVALFELGAGRSRSLQGLERQSVGPRGRPGCSAPPARGLFSYHPRS